MTIVIESTKASALSTAGTSNNPIIAWDNIATTGTMSTDEGTEVESAALAVTGTTYDAWIATPNGSGQASLELTLPSAQDVEFVAIAAHNLGAISAKVRIQYSTDGGSSWTDSGAGPVTPTDDQAIGFYFTAINAANWRVRVFDAGSNDVEIAVALFAEPITVEQRIYQGYTPPITPTNVTLQSNVSVGGNAMGNAVVTRGSSSSATLTHLGPSTLRGSDWKSFQAYFNDGNRFFWAWRPTKYGDLHYAWRDGATIMPTNSGPKDYMSLDMEMRFYDSP
jgi:hypothetical protein